MYNWTCNTTFSSFSLFPPSSLPLPLPLPLPLLLQQGLTTYSKLTDFKIFYSPASTSRMLEHRHVQLLRRLLVDSAFFLSSFPAPLSIAGPPLFLFSADSMTSVCSALLFSKRSVWVSRAPFQEISENSRKTSLNPPSASSSPLT